MKQKENIFKNAYFGKPYKTRDGRKALYWRYVNRNGEFIHHLILPNKSGKPMSKKDEIIANKEGKNLNTSYTELSTDIVSEWQEEVNKAELDKLTLDAVKQSLFSNPNNTEFTAYSCGFKDGCRKALEYLILDMKGNITDKVELWK